MGLLQNELDASEQAGNITTDQGFRLQPRPAGASPLQPRAYALCRPSPCWVPWRVFLYPELRKSPGVLTESATDSRPILQSKSFHLFSRS